MDQLSEQRRVGRIALCITEDWFALSHFKPLMRALRGLAQDVVVITRDGGRGQEFTAAGVRLVPFDYRRGSINPMDAAKVAGALGDILARERPDVVHAVSLKPITLASVALRRWPEVPLVLHVTGIGLLAAQRTWRNRLLLATVMRTLGEALKRPHVRVLAENEDDVRLVADRAGRLGGRFGLLGGAGVDPEHFTPMAEAPWGSPRVAYVGRMVRSKGVETLVEAAHLLQRAGRPVPIDLFGPIDTGNREAIQERDIRRWQTDGLVTWHGPITDVREVWRNAAVFAMAPHGGEGMPRAMLEAAACGRPLVVTDVPGCRQFVRQQVEGFVVPPGRPSKLAAAIARLAGDRHLRQTMGAAARARVLDGFTERHVEDAVQHAYRQLLAGADR